MSKEKIAAARRIIVARNNGPELPPPVRTLSSSALAAQSVGTSLGSERVRDEIMQALLKHGIKTTHVGGALPPLFREDVKQGDSALVKYLGYEMVGAERSGTDNGFTSLRFDVVDPQTLTITHRASMPMAAVMSSFFQCEEKTVEIEIDGKKKTIDEEHPQLAPDECPLLLITFGGTGPQKKQGRNPAKMWVIEALPLDVKIAGELHAGKKKASA